MNMNRCYNNLLTIPSVRSSASTISIFVSEMGAHVCYYTRAYGEVLCDADEITKYTETTTRHLDNNFTITIHKWKSWLPAFCQNDDVNGCIHWCSHYSAVIQRELRFTLISASSCIIIDVTMWWLKCIVAKRSKDIRGLCGPSFAFRFVRSGILWARARCRCAEKRWWVMH